MYLFCFIYLFLFACFVLVLYDSNSKPVSMLLRTILGVHGPTGDGFPVVYLGNFKLAKQLPFQESSNL